MCSLPESGQGQLGSLGLGESNAARVDETEPLNLLKEEDFLNAAQRTAGTGRQRRCER